MIIGFFYIFKDRFVHEGFQTPSSYCAPGGPNQCSLQCHNRTSDELPRESSNEEAIYDLYDQENLDLIRQPPASGMTPYNTGQQLTDFTVGASVPWDYDNLSMDPTQTMWGVVFPSCSLDIYYKAYHRVVYGSGNNFEYNIDTGAPVFRDPQFGISTTDHGMQALLETADFFFMTIAGQIVSEPFAAIKYGTLGAVDLEMWTNASKETSRFEMDAKRGYSLNPADEFYPSRNIGGSIGGAAGLTTENLIRRPLSERQKVEVIDPSTGKSIGPIGTKLTSAEIAARRDTIFNSIITTERTNAMVDRLTSTIDGATLDQKKANLQAALERAEIANPGEAMKNSVERLANKRAQADAHPSAFNQMLLGPIGAKMYNQISKTSVGKYVAASTARLGNIIVSNTVGTLTRTNTRLGAFIGKQSVKLGVLKSVPRVTAKLASLVVSVVEGLGICEAFIAPFALAQGPGAAAIVGPGSALCATINFGLTIICQAIVPAILQSLTADDSVCPPGMKTIYTALVEAAPGKSEWLYTILSSSPGILGDFLGATGDFVCWSIDENVFWPIFVAGATAGTTAAIPAVIAAAPGGPAAQGAAAMGAGFGASISVMSVADQIAKSTSNELHYNTLTGAFVPQLDTAAWCGIKASMKVPYMYPAYYYDSTLSIFFDNKPKLTSLEPAWQDPYAYRQRLDSNGRFTGPYPVWVDFADVRMLDKMAQFYNDFSRLYMTSNEDGSVTFEYIKKMYAIIASSKYSCDVQCSINSITFMPQSGVVLCDIPVPTTPGNPTFYHDRRFYFWIDLKQGIQGDAGRTALAAAGRGADLMADNVAKYIVTGCTNTDGTGPDAIDVTSGESYVADAVVSLGDVYNANTHVSNSTATTLAKNGTLILDVSGVITNAFVRNATAAKTSSAYMNALNALKTLDISGVTISGTEITTGAIQISRNSITRYPEIEGYYYPPKNADINLGNIQTIPIDDTCRNVSDSMVRYGTATQTQQADIQRRRQTRTISRATFIKSSDPVQWPGATDYKGHKSAKIFSTYYQPRGPNGAGSDKQIGLGFTQNFIVNSLPFAFGILGMAATTALQNYGILDAVHCLYQDVRNQDGSFVVNDILMTSEPGVIINRGPIVTYAPGYTPTINKCKKVFLQQTDCVSRYAIRRFLKKFDTEAREGNTSSFNKITTIYNINTIQDIGGTGQQCTYTVGYTPFDKTTNVSVGSETRASVGVKMEQTTSDMTCAYKPTRDHTILYSSANPSPDPTPIVFTSIVNPPLTVLPAASQPQNPSFKLATCTNTAYTPSASAPTTTGCMYPALKENLVIQFNAAHYGTAHIDAASVTGGFALVPSDRYDSAKCAYQVTVLDVLRAKMNAMVVTMTLAPPLIDNCMYNLAADDYPERYYLEKIPHNPLTVPDYMPEPTQVKLPTPGCETGEFTDCSGTAIIENVIRQFNSASTDRQIYKVLSASTPSATQCDYQVEMSRLVVPGTVNSRIVHQDSIRINVQQNGTNKCLYDRVSDGTDIINSGTSLVSGNSPPPFKTPYVFTTNILQSATKSLNTYIQSMLGLPIDTALSTITSESNKNMQTVLQNVYNTGAPLSNCPTQTCKTPSVIQAIVNRYNYDNFPPYPSGQYGYTQSAITEIHRVGSVKAPIGQSCCHVELIERQDVYQDYLQKPIPSLTKFYLREYQFYLVNGATQCNYTVKPFTRADLSANIMDISSNAYGIMSDASVLSPYIYVPSPSMPDPNIPCFNTAVLDKVRAVYNGINIAPPGTGVKTNTLVSIQRGFNPLPNVCEYSATVDHVFYDKDYKKFYTVKGSTTYLRATWSTAGTGGSRYEVDTGVYSGTPTVEEFFPPQLTITATSVSQTLQTGVTQTNIQLPYLYFENIPAGNTRVQMGANKKGYTFSV